MTSDIAVGYSRLSQSGREGSIGVQKDDIRMYAESNGYHLDRIYDDGEYSSGYYETDREAYEALRDRLDAGDVDAVIVRDKDRLSRDKLERMKLLIELIELGIELHSCESGLVELDGYGLAVEGFHAATADEKKKQEIERSRRATQERIDAGAWHGRPPFGFETDETGENLVPDPDEFSEACRILDALDTGESIRSAADSAESTRARVESAKERRERIESWRDEESK